ncbi:BRO family protein [Caloranaerobacter sp. DY30410]|uniref:BRO family protein n=1 Tax=Caloranaerobacter sp. DY30410 TaxID=3238305 RepID=UPI003D04B051
MKDLQVFSNNEFGRVRVIIRNNEPWFIGKDIAEILGYSNPSKAVIMHVDEEDRIKEMIAHSQNGNMVKTQTTLINESGLYSLILSSKLPTAKKFKRWVTSEVLPSIRKHGAYMTDEVLEKALTSPDFLIQLATKLKEERQKRLEAERFNKQIAASENSILVRQVAKIASKKGINIGEKRLWNKLREWGLIFKNSTEPKQKYIDKGYFEVIEGVRESSNGTFTYRTTRVTGKGQVYIIKRLIEESMQEEVAVTR